MGKTEKPSANKTTPILRLREAMSNGASATEIAAVAAEVDALLAAEHERVYRVCLKFLGNPDTAKDAAQDVMVKAYAKLPEFRGDSSLSTWLYSIARYHCFYIRRQTRNMLDDENFGQLLDDNPGALTILRRDERIALFQEAAEAVLTPLERKAVHLRYVEMVSQDQLTELLGLDNASGGRGLLQRCRRKLEREIRRRLEEMGHGTSFVRRTL